MPAKSAAVKIRAVRSYGAHVELIDTALTSRAARLEELRRADPAARVASPYDDPYVIAGNASLGWEIFGRPPERQPELLLVPVGGGGLASGLVVARNALGAPTAIWGAEPALANDAARSLRSGRLESNAQAEPPTLCDGARTASLGQRNFEILKVGLAGILEVDETAVVAAVRLLFEAANLKAEPTGALPLAALLSAPERFAGRRVACVVSGGNVDGELYAKLLAG
jgi:threonine dehydratase